MFTRTSELAIRTLILIVFRQNGKPLKPGLLATELGCSPSYLAKTLQLLVKGGILSSVRGAGGGVMFERDPADVSLLEIFQACQGLLIGGYCQAIGTPLSGAVCSYHEAMQELHRVTVQTLSKWTLADLLRRPARKPRGTAEDSPCKIYFEGCPAIGAKS